MKNEDLIKELENTELPEIEIQSHRTFLRTALLSSDYFKKTGFFEIFRRYLALTVPALAVLVILGVVVIGPKLSEAKALKIARNNPEIKRLIEDKKMVLSGVKLKDGNAYVLLNSPKTESITGINIQKNNSTSEDMEGAIVKVNLDKKEVSQINSINSEEIAPLKDTERESAKEIANSEEVVGRIVPREAIIEKVQSSLPKKIRLIERNNIIEATSETNGGQEARVHYKLDGRKWVVKVNLNEKKVEEIEYSSDNNKGRDYDNNKGREE